MPDRLRAMFRSVLLAGALCLLAGCNTLHFEISDQPAAHVQQQRMSYFAWGLFPEVQVDASRFCPDGVAAIREETTFVDGIFAGITLGLYSPRTATYHCLGRSS